MVTTLLSTKFNIELNRANEKRLMKGVWLFKHTRSKHRRQLTQRFTGDPCYDQPSDQQLTSSNKTTSKLATKLASKVALDV